MTRTGTAPRTAITRRFNALDRTRAQALIGALAIAAYSVSVSTSLIDFVLRFALSVSFAALAIWCASVWWSVVKELGERRPGSEAGEAGRRPMRG